MQHTRTSCSRTPAASLHANLVNRFPRYVPKTTQQGASWLADFVYISSSLIALALVDASPRGLLIDGYTNTHIPHRKTLLLAWYLTCIVSHLKNGQESLTLGLATQAREILLGTASIYRVSTESSLRVVNSSWRTVTREG
jgi:hypothetical protein